jgi:predicted DNA repair protein MutK
VAGATLFTLLDDIASLLDDISTMSHVAVNKTAGVLGDDLALNAKQVSGVSPDRELPVVWRVAVGSAINKAILIPAAVGISAVAPWAILPLLMIGGIYLCYEGVEKLLHAWLHPSGEEHQAHREAVADPEVNLVQHEKNKIRGAIRTDFILSAEIIVITLGTLAGKSLLVTMGVLIAIGVLMTVGVYGLVALIVKLDDLGLRWMRVSGNSTSDAMFRSAGRGILWFAPHLLRFLSVAGTAAMFLVGGGIITHQWHDVHHASESFAAWLGSIPWVGWLLHWAGPLLFNFAFGILAGACAVGLVAMAKTIWAFSPWGQRVQRS